MVCMWDFASMSWWLTLHSGAVACAWVHAYAYTRACMWVLGSERGHEDLEALLLPILHYYFRLTVPSPKDTIMCPLCALMLAAGGSRHSRHWPAFHLHLVPSWLPKPWAVRENLLQKGLMLCLALCCARCWQCDQNTHIHALRRRTHAHAGTCTHTNTRTLTVHLQTHANMVAHGMRDFPPPTWPLRSTQNSLRAFLYMEYLFICFCFFAPKAAIRFGRGWNCKRPTLVRKVALWWTAKASSSLSNFS